MLLVMFVFGIIMSVELDRESLHSSSYDAETVYGDEEEYNEVGGLIDWIPGVSTAKALFNHIVDPVANAVKFTNANATASSFALGALTVGGSFVSAVMANPVKSSSLVKIAANDAQWDKYCAELSKTNTFATCKGVPGIGGMNDIRPRLQQIHKDATNTGPRKEVEMSFWKPSTWKSDGKPKTTIFEPIH